VAVRKLSGQDSNNTNHIYFIIILCCCCSRNQWRISNLVVDKKEENYNSRFNWRNSPIYLWNHSNLATSKLWKSICSIRWSIYIFIYYLGALIDKKRPDKYEIVGSLIVILGAAIIYYSPRS
jgi:hypothetical protein